MKYIESPQSYSKKKGKALFLAGGITNCPDWQSAVVKLLHGTQVTVLNPRRKIFPINDPTAATEQIKWEFEHLRKADAILFWFPKESICPIALYELGAWSMTEKHLFIGVHQKYPRKKDIEEQTKLVRPSINIFYSLEEVVNQALLFIRMER